MVITSNKQISIIISKVHTRDSFNTSLVQTEHIVKSNTYNITLIASKIKHCITHHSLSLCFPLQNTPSVVGTGKLIQFTGTGEIQTLNVNQVTVSLTSSAGLIFLGALWQCWTISIQ